LVAARGNLTAPPPEPRKESRDASKCVAIPGDRVKEALLGANARDEHRGVGDGESNSLGDSTDGDGQAEELECHRDVVGVAHVAIRAAGLNLTFR
jgi:hypothetical protein